MRFLRSSHLQALVVAFGLLLSASAFAQTPAMPLPAGSPAPATPAQPSRITLDVLVTDKQGNSIPGLDARDFTLLDNGQQRPLVDFRVIDPRKNPDALHVMIVVDMINTGVNEIAFEREQLEEFLNQDGGQLAHPTQLAVFTEHGARIMPNASEDGHALVTEFQKVGTDLRMIGRSAGFYGAAERLQYSLTELQQLIAYEATQPGRKIIVFLSPGWPMFSFASVQADRNQRNWVFNTLTEMTDTIQKAHVSLYSADPYLLGRTDPFFYRTYLKPVRKPEQADYGVLALQVLADHSGGRALTMGRDVRGQLNTAMRDAGPYYQLTFEPQPADQPNEYHEIRVQVDRPDTVARTNAGYYAQIEPVGNGKTVKPTKAPKP